MKISKLKFNPNNPRKCSKDKLEKLMRSIESLPEMMKLRPMAKIVSKTAAWGHFGIGMPWDK